MMWNNYRLEIQEYEWTDRDRTYMDACLFIVDNRASIRGTCNEFLLYKSSLHRYIHERLKYVSDELYYCVKGQLSWNAKNASHFNKIRR